MKINAASGLGVVLGGEKKKKGSERRNALISQDFTILKEVLTTNFDLFVQGARSRGKAPVKG